MLRLFKYMREPVYSQSLKGAENGAMQKLSLGRSQRFKKWLLAAGIAGVLGEGGAIMYELKKGPAEPTSVSAEKIKTAKDRFITDSMPPQRDVIEHDDIEVGMEDEIDPFEAYESAGRIADLIKAKYPTIDVQCSGGFCTLSVKNDAPDRDKQILPIFGYSFDLSDNCKIMGTVSGRPYIKNDPEFGDYIEIEDEMKDPVIDLGPDQEKDIISAIDSAWQFRQEHKRVYDELKKGQDQEFKTIEEFLSQGKFLEDLVRGNFIKESLLYPLHVEYYKGWRPDPNNYDKLISEYLFKPE